MTKTVVTFLLALIGVAIVDQNIKTLFVEGYFIDTACITFGYALNKGVAFSMFAFLGEHLKWILLGLILSMIALSFWQKWVRDFPFAMGLLFGSALSNLYDRFIHGGVVDYIYWHCYFDFAIFNFADVAINLSVLLILWGSYRAERRLKEK
jgi:signal peptidase II